MGTGIPILVDVGQHGQHRCCGPGVLNTASAVFPSEPSLYRKELAMTELDLR